MIENARHKIKTKTYKFGDPEVIFFLRWSEKEEERMKRIEECTHCDSEGNVECYECDGSGRVECSEHSQIEE